LYQTGSHTPHGFGKVFENTIQWHLLDLAEIQDGGIMQNGGIIQEGGKYIFASMNSTANDDIQ
jgi:hypothetical protein